jgi:toxin ParE1/3/4
MQVHKTDRFFAELETIVDFIAQDSLKRAKYFSDELSQKIMNLPHFPYKYRQSKKSTDTHIRELIFEGYVIPYRIDTLKENIVILGIFSENEWKL